MTQTINSRTSIYIKWLSAPDPEGLNNTGLLGSLKLFYDLWFPERSTETFP